VRGARRALQQSIGDESVQPIGEDRLGNVQMGGLCLVAGLLEVQRLAPQGGLGVLTSAYYALTYLGFAAPYLMTLASRATSYVMLLVIASGLAVLTAGVVTRGSR